MIPTIPLVNRSYLYMSGLGLTWVSNTTITVAAGHCRDSTDINDITLSTTGNYAPAVAATPITLSVAAVGANALDTGTVAASTLYNVFIVGDSTKHNAPCGLISLSATAPVLPFGYDMFRRIGSVRTDGSSHILLFWQYGGNTTRRTMWYDAAFATGISVGASTSYAAVNLESTVPVTASSVIIEASLTAGTAFDSVFLQEFGGTSSQAIFSSPVTGTALKGMVECPVGLNAGVADLKYKVSSSGDSVALFVQAYVDQL